MKTAKYGDLYIGQKASLTKTASDAAIRQIADASQDYNPIHLDDEYSAGTIFGARIAHGLFCLGLASNLIGNILPGNGSIFVRESVNYRRPVYVGDTITCEVEVLDLLGHGKVLLSYKCVNEKDQIVMNGDTLVKVPE